VTKSAMTYWKLISTGDPVQTGDPVGQTGPPLHRLEPVPVIGNAIDKKLLSTINKILIDKISIRSLCY
jgi:hypothetical protein